MLQKKATSYTKQNYYNTSRDKHVHQANTDAIQPHQPLDLFLKPGDFWPQIGRHKYQTRRKQ